MQQSTGLLLAIFAGASDPPKKGIDDVEREKMPETGVRISVRSRSSANPGDIKFAAAM